jgi:hypothetical protein
MFRRWARLIAVGAVAFGVLPAPWMSTPATAATGTVTAFRFVSFRGDTLGGGQSKTFTDTIATFAVTGGSGGIRFSVTTATDHWSGEIGALPGYRLRPGWFPNAGAPGDGVHPYLRLDGNGRACNTSFGGFVVDSVQFNASGDVTELSLRFRHLCEAADAAPLVGWLNYNSVANPLPVELTAQDPSVVPGQPVTLGVNVAYHGTAPTGSVSFFDGSTLLGAVPVGGFGVAKLTLNSLKPGSHSINATYTGDANYPASTSTAITQTVSSARSYFWFTGGSGDFITRGTMANFAAGNSGLFIGYLGPFLQAGSNDAGDWLVQLTPPAGATFHAGSTYPIAVNADATHAGVNFGGDGRGCNSTSGSLTIRRIATNASGVLTALNAKFLQHCDFPTDPPSVGTIVLNT